MYIKEENTKQNLFLFGNVYSVVMCSNVLILSYLQSHASYYSCSAQISDMLVGQRKLSRIGWYQTGNRISPIGPVMVSTARKGQLK